MLLLLTDILQAAWMFCLPGGGLVVWGVRVGVWELEMQDFLVSGLKTGRPEPFSLGRKEKGALRTLVTKQEKIGETGRC